MKNLISFFFGIAAAIFIFFLDSKLINWIVGLLPASVADWKHFLRIVFWVIAVFSTGAIAVVVGLLVGAIVSTLLEGKKRR